MERSHPIASQQIHFCTQSHQLLGHLRKYHLGNVKCQMIINVKCQMIRNVNSFSAKTIDQLKILTQPQRVNNELHSGAASSPFHPALNFCSYEEFFWNFGKFLRVFCSFRGECKQARKKVSLCSDHPLFQNVFFANSVSRIVALSSRSVVRLWTCMTSLLISSE